MTLAPVFKSVDPQFNEGIARRAYDLVMKMDEDEARAFTTHVVANIMWDDMDANQRTLQRHLDGVIRKRVERLAKTLDRTYINKSLVALESESGEFADREKVLAYAGALGVIAKAMKTPYDYGYVFEESDFRRDPSTGRFQAKVNYSGQGQPLKGKGAPKQGVKEGGGKPSPAARREHQEAYQQLGDFMRSFDTADTDFFLHWEDKQTGQRFTDRVSETNRPPEFDPEKQRALGVEARPTTLSAGGAAFGLVGALGGSPEQARYRGSQAGVVDQKMGDFARDWGESGRGSPHSNQRLYDRMYTGSKYLQEVAPTGSKTQMAARFGQFMGEHGAEAEKVLGAQTRKTMYRYRGTERQPDAELVAQYSRLSGGYSFDQLTPEQHQEVRGLENRALGAARRAMPEGQEVPQERRKMIIQRVRGEYLASQGEEGSARRQGRDRARAAAVKYFTDSGKVPDPRLSNLQLHSGHTPPSQGIIVDRSGKIATQAVGYGDDHYLPFNLKNLKGLKGGEYIRTRTHGGPTSEDIYTGLVSGARAVTVVSNSGTFTVEFAEDFRGGRRYNQKASRMVDRYEHLLDAVQSGQVSRQGIPPEVDEAIRNDVEENYRSHSLSEQRQIYNRKVDEFKKNPVPTSQMYRVWEAQAKKETDNPREQREMIQAQEEAFLEGSEWFYRLNGQGYKSALFALQEQFPYYLKEPTVEVKRRGEGYKRDRGYVKPRYNRPGEALAGYYDPTITGFRGEGRFEGTGKIPADRVDYQNYEGRALNPKIKAAQAKEERDKAAAEVKEGEGAAEGAQAPEATSQRDAVRQAAADIQRRESAAEHVIPLRNTLRKIAGDTSPGAIVNRTEYADDYRKLFELDDAGLKMWAADPSGMNRITELARAARDSVIVPDTEGPEKRAAVAFRDKVEQDLAKFAEAKDSSKIGVYDPEKSPDQRGSIPRQPWRFQQVEQGASVDRLREMIKPAEERLRNDAGFDFTEATPTEEHRTALQGLLAVREMNQRFSYRGVPADPEVLRENAPGALARVPEKLQPFISRPVEQTDQLIDAVHLHWRLSHDIQAIPEPAKASLETHRAQQKNGPTFPTFKSEAAARKRDEWVASMQGVLDDEAAPDYLKDAATEVLTGLEGADESHLPEVQRQVDRMMSTSVWQDHQRRMRGPRELGS